MKKNLFFALFSILVWSTLSPITKLLLSNNLPSMEALFFPAIIAVITLIPFVVFSPSRHCFSVYRFKDYASICGLSCLGSLLYNVFYYKGLSILKAQEATILNYLWPVFLVAFSCLILKEKLTIMKIFALLFSFAGVVVLCAGGSFFQSEKIIGVLCCLGASSSYALFCVLNKKAGYDQKIVMLFMWLITAIGSLLIGLRGEAWRIPTAKEWLGFSWLGIVTNALAYLFWALALQNSNGTAFIANLSYIAPFISVFLSSKLLGEKIEPRAILALVLIVGGILLQVFVESARSKHNISSQAQKG